MMDCMDEAFDLMGEYDSLPHVYGDDTLYQAETHVIQQIGRQPGITVTDLAAMMNKTASACSQIVRKLRDKGWVSQSRNDQNRREYNLDLTGDGWRIYDNHERFDRECFQRTFSNLDGLDDQMLETYLDVQRRLNDSFRQDVRDCPTSLEDAGKK